MPQRRGLDPQREGASWFPGDSELGWIIENRVDEAYLLSWPGQLENYKPIHDTGGYDRVRAPLGSYDYRLDQIKGTSSLHSGNQVRISFNVSALHPRRHFDFTFLHYDLKTRDLVDPAWLVPSTKLSEVCYRASVPSARLREFVANRSGLARDRAARYQVAVRELAAARGWSVLPPKLSRSPSNSPSPLVEEGRSGGPAPTVSEHPVETGIFFKRHFDAAFLEAATGDEVLMLAEPDVFGRHRIAFSKASGHWASIAVHGAASASATNLIQANIHAATFFPHPRYYILVQHFDRRRAEWYPWSWLIRSTDFARLARGKGAYLLFTTTLNPTHTNRWTPHRIRTSQVAAAFRAVLHGSMLRRAA